MTGLFCSARNATLKCTRYSTLRDLAQVVVLFPRKAPIGVDTVQMHFWYPNTYIVQASGLSFLQKGHLFLEPNQTLIIAGCFTGDGEENAWMILPNHVSSIPRPLYEYQSNASEADTRIWRHATQAQASNILIYSPDTVVYNIGLGLVNHTSKQYIVQLNVPYAEEIKYLHIKNLYQALEKDPDLAALPKENLGVILQTLFICTGCDFIQYFKTVGKATFLNNFFQNAEFICGPQLPGCYMTPKTQAMASCHLFVWLEQATLRLRDTVRAWFSYRLQPPVATVPLHSPS